MTIARCDSVDAGAAADHAAAAAAAAASAAVAEEDFGGAREGKRGEGGGGRAAAAAGGDDAPLGDDGEEDGNDRGVVVPASAGTTRPATMTTAYSDTETETMTAAGAGGDGIGLGAASAASFMSTAPTVASGASFMSQSAFGGGAGEEEEEQERRCYICFDSVCMCEDDDGGGDGGKKCQGGKGGSGGGCGSKSCKLVTSPCACVDRYVHRCCLLKVGRLKEGRVYCSVIHGKEPCGRCPMITTYLSEKEAIRRILLAAPGLLTDKLAVPYSHLWVLVLCIHSRGLFFVSPPSPHDFP